MTLDLVVRGGTVVDGTGAPARRADVGVRGGLVVAIGAVDETAARSVDADGCIVAPGFVDPHTHYDAQLCWDPTASPSSLHGVTTVVIGLCGFGVAPCPDGGADYLLRSLEMVEEIPFESTAAGIDFRWGSWADYARTLDARGLGVNVAGFVPHSALRYHVMGERARREPATDDDRAALVAELRRSLDAGAIGFATSRGPNHTDAYGEPVPSRHADDAELRALVDACRGRVWQINVRTKFGADAVALNDEVDAYARWTAEAGARLSWTPFHAEPANDVWRDVLAHTRELNERGIPVLPQVAVQPVAVTIRFDEPSYLVIVAGWDQPLRGFYDLDVDGRLALLRDPAVRAAMRAAPEDETRLFAPVYREWIVLGSTTRPDLVGRSVADAAAGQRQHPAEFICDLALADRLATVLQVPAVNRGKEGIAQLVSDEHTLIGLGDAGAHVRSVANFTYPTDLLTRLVRDEGVLSLERAVHRITAQPAAYLGLRDRGVLAPGRPADIVVFDLDRLALRPLEVRTDLPAGAERLFQGAEGYVATIVNGVVAVEEGQPTGDATGVVVRVS